ncbi:hypothetical protein B0H14DRAFT_2632163 [Mycena olivaceomarginata]|nr:hypothetical protein B0H14DRAFT_2632163 [Mycena olivaceomarginata]
MSSPDAALSSNPGHNLAEDGGHRRVARIADNLTPRSHKRARQSESSLRRCRVTLPTRTPMSLGREGRAVGENEEPHPAKKSRQAPAEDGEDDDGQEDQDKEMQGRDEEENGADEEGQQGERDGAGRWGLAGGGDGPQEKGEGQGEKAQRYGSAGDQTLQRVGGLGVLGTETVGRNGLVDGSCTDPHHGLYERDDLGPSRGDHQNAGFGLGGKTAGKRTGAPLNAAGPYTKSSQAIAANGKRNCSGRLADYIIETMSVAAWGIDWAAMEGKGSNKLQNGYHADTFFKLHKTCPTRDAFRRSGARFGPVVFLDLFWAVDNLVGDRRSKSFPKLLTYVMEHVPEELCDVNQGTSIADSRWEGSWAALQGVTDAIDPALTECLYAFVRQYPDETVPLEGGD